ncbi:MAG: D-alanyl-D-alanine carboxypeptidase family protein [Pseudoxanthomonas sp.]
MRARHRILLNTADIELWPAWLLCARGNADARALAQAEWCLRRKRDGRYLAASSPRGLLPLLPHWTQDVDSDAALDALAPTRHGESELPLLGLKHRLDLLGLDAQAYEARTGLALVAEPATLALAGFDRYRRPLWLTAATARAWNLMQGSARRDGIALDAISGYRSHDYQLGIFERKLARGQTVAQILNVNAAPGYSEHHSGHALDIGTPDEPPAEESFEHTDAFAWLTQHAGGFGFRMSYPRDNPHGIVYEPWHWYFAP